MGQEKGAFRLELSWEQQAQFAGMFNRGVKKAKVTENMTIMYEDVSTWDRDVVDVVPDDDSYSQDDEGVEVV